MDQTSLTPKAARTRQRILDVALELFVSQGYEATTMREIAAAAGCSLGLAYRYFSRKEDLVLVFYQQMAAETARQIEALEVNTLADRFQAVMRYRLEQMTPHREALSALFGAAMNPNADTGVLGDSAVDMRKQAQAAFLLLVTGAKDKLKPPQDEQMATLLYSAHLGVILFWFYDRSPGQRATYEMLDFIHESLDVVRGFLILPFVAQPVARLAKIAEAVFVGDSAIPL